jgi:hypothetical protein|tara:strand:- start:780 stop:1166 length:387 start_codon:yes stop_codon:yes gene_type:complete
MGRYYTGDIEGKFMFAVQGSYAGERFGAVKIGCTTDDFTNTDSIHYQVNRKSYDYILKELRLIKESGAIERVRRMYEEHNGWNNKIGEKFGVSRKNLQEYADYCMGNQIKDWFDNNLGRDYLHFEAEC